MIVPARVGRRGTVVPAFQIDDEFAEQVLAHMWFNSSKGYLMAHVGGRMTKLHRFVWTLKHGSCPPMLDHVYGDKLDNRLENLRPADRSLNCTNARHPRRKYDLPPGVRKQKPSCKSRPYRAVIRQAGRQRFLGCYATPQEAAAAYEAERARLIAEAADRCRTAFETNTPEEKTDD